MRRSRRQSLLALAGLLLAALLAVPPFLFGIAAERQLASEVARLARHAGLVVAGHSSHRGWLATEAESVLRVAGLPVEIVAQHRLDHGPLPLARWLEGEFDGRPVRALARTRLSLRLAASPQDEAAALAPELAAAGIPPLRLEIAVRLDGRREVRFEQAAFAWPSARGGLDWRGLHGRLDLDETRRTLALEANAPRLAVHGLVLSSDGESHERVAFEGAGLRVRLEQVGGNLFGETRLTLGRLALAPFVEAHTLVLAATARADAHDGRYVRLTLSGSLATGALAGQALGPARLEIVVRRLDAERLARFVAERGMRGDGRPAESLSPRLIGELLALAAALAKHAPILEVNAFSLRVGTEEIRGRARFVLDGRRLDVVGNPLRLVAALRGEAELAIPARLLARWYLPELHAALADYVRRGLLDAAQAARLAPAQLEALAEAALPYYLAQHELARHLVRDGADYKLSLVVRRGQLLVNGEPWLLTAAVIP